VVGWDHGAVRLFPSTAVRNRVVRDLLVAGALLGLAAVAVRRYVPVLTDAVALREFVAGFGVWAPLAFVSLQAFQVVFAPLPGQVLGFAAGYLFGAGWGTVYSLVGVTVGSAGAFVLSRKFGRPYVARVVAPETLAEFDALPEERGLLGLFLAFLVPGLPDDAICFVAGLTDIPLWKLVVVAVVGRLPGFLLAALAGASVAGAHLLRAFGVVAVLLALSVVGYHNRARLVAVLRGE